MNRRFAPLLALLFSVLTTPAFGEVVTLQQAVKRALESNHLLKAASLEKGAAEEGVAVSRSRYLPRVSLESGAVLSNTPSTVFMMKLDEARISPAKDFAADTLNNPSPRGDFKTAVTLEQPLVDFGISNGVAMAGKGAEAAALSEEARREEIAFRVYMAYLEVRKAQAYREVAEQSVINAREHDRLAALREKDGIGLKSERLRTATAVAEAEQRVVAANNAQLIARMRLNLVVGGAQGGTLDIGDMPRLEEPSSETEQLIVLAQKSRPDLKSAENAVERGELAVKQARNAYLPTLYARGSYQLNDRDMPFGTDKDSWNVGVNLRWELFDGMRRSHEKTQAELTKRSAAEMLENERREVALQVTESVLHRQEALLRLESARSAVRDAEESRRLVTLRFGNGLSPLVEVMDAETALDRARANLVEVENASYAATAEVYFRTGVLIQEVMR